MSKHNVQISHEALCEDKLERELASVRELLVYIIRNYYNTLLLDIIIVCYILITIIIYCEYDYSRFLALLLLYVIIIHNNSYML